MLRLKYAARICNGQSYKEIEANENGYPVYGSGGVFAYAEKPIYVGESVLLGRKGTIR
jgi:type I restriction enzyme S subunit